MPWKIVNEEGKFKVYKLDADNKPTGKPVGTHMDEMGAKAQMRALYASEKKPKKESEPITYTTAEGATITATITDSNGISTTEVKELKMMDEMPMEPMKNDMGGMMMAGPCSWDELDAMEQAEEMTEELYGMNDKMGMMARNIMQSPMIEDKAAALADLAKGYAERMGQMMKPAEKSVDDIVKQIAGDSNQPEEDDRPDELKAVWTGKYIGSLPDSSFLYVEEGCKTKGCRHFPVKDAQGKLDLPHLRNAIARIPQSNAPGLSPEKKTQLQKRAQTMLENSNKKDLFIWKEGDRYYCLLAYSNNRRDDDNPPEIISSESHKEFDLALEKGEWPMPELWLWHIPYKIGDVFYHAYDEQNGFPIAGAVFDKDKDWLAEGLLEAGWDGVSHGMPEQWIQRDKEDPTIIVRHRTKEISILPRWAAANKLAFTYVYKENEMAEQEKSLPAHKREALNELGEDKAQKFLEALGDVAEKADEAGIEKKALRQAHPRELPGAGDETQEQPLTPDNPIVKALEMVVTRLDALDTRLKTIEDKQVVVEEKEQPFDLMEFLKKNSAVGQPTTKVRSNSKEAKDAPEEAKQESWTERASGIRVSLVDELVGANQAYYQEYPNNGR